MYLPLAGCFTSAGHVLGYRNIPSTTTTSTVCTCVCGVEKVGSMEYGDFPKAIYSLVELLNYGTAKFSFHRTELGETIKGYSR